MLTGNIMSWQAALQLSKEQGLALAALTRTMIGHLSALSQRFKALDDVEGGRRPVDSPLQNGEGPPRQPAAASSPDDDVHRPALRRSSPELAALRVSAVSGPSMPEALPPCMGPPSRTIFTAFSAIPGTRHVSDPGTRHGSNCSSHHQRKRVMPL